LRGENKIRFRTKESKERERDDGWRGGKEGGTDGEDGGS